VRKKDFAAEAQATRRAPNRLIFFALFAVNFVFRLGKEKGGEATNASPPFYQSKF